MEDCKEVVAPLVAIIHHNHGRRTTWEVRVIVKCGQTMPTQDNRLPKIYSAHLRPDPPLPKLLITACFNPFVEKAPEETWQQIAEQVSIIVTKLIPDNKNQC
jgi:hypothetical protein